MCPRGKGIVGVRKQVRGFCAVVYLLMGFVQCLTITASLLDAWPGSPWVFDALVALGCAYMPVIGTIIAMMGATDVWDWRHRSALLFFGWPYLLYAVLALWCGTVALVRRSRGP
jgi:hypothetical protein